MGCGGSTEAGQPASGQPASGKPTSNRGAHVWAKGVGTSFEFLNDSNLWQPITDPYVINKLGQLCAHNITTTVTYSSLASGQKYRASQDPDGLIAQTNIHTGVVRHIRLVPHFFEFEEGPHDWRPVTDPEALMALTAVLASSLPKTYKYTSKATGYQGEAESTLCDPRGLIEQRNLVTQKKRRIRCTPVGPDGQPHFEFHDNNDVWRSVSECCVKQLAAVAAGRGDAYYSINHVAGPAAGQTFHYHASLGADGFITQRNTGTNAKREVRPAPWLGHARAALTAEREGSAEEGPRIRADPTNGYYRGAPEEEQREPVAPKAVPVAMPVVAPSYEPPVAQPVTMATPIGGQTVVPTATTTTTTMMMTQMPASSFYSPEVVPMGTAVDPVAVQEVAAVPMAQQVYYYQPSVMEPTASALPMAQVL